MKTQNLIERYMSQLDQYLSHIPATEKAEIILELHTHIQDSLSNSDKTVEEVLNGLGTPEEAARRYLDERGLSISFPNLGSTKSETGKWLTIAFLGSVGLFMAFSVFIMLFFSPLVEVKEEQGTVKILGGLINVQENMSKKKNKGLKKDSNKEKKQIQAHLEFSGTDEGKQKNVEINIEGDEDNPEIRIKVDGIEVDEDKTQALSDLKINEEDLEKLEDLENIESLSDLKKLEKLKDLKILENLKELKNLKIKIED